MKKKNYKNYNLYNISSNKISTAGQGIEERTMDLVEIGMPPFLCTIRQVQGRTKIKKNVRHIRIKNFHFNVTFTFTKT